MFKSLLIFYLRCIKRLNSPSDIINFSFRKYKDKTFLIDPDKNLTLTFGQWEERVKKITLKLNETGLRKGETIAFSAPNCVEYFVLRAAAHLSGIIFLGLPAHLARKDIEYFLTKTNARAISYGRKGDNLDIAILQKTTTTNLPSDTATFNLSSATTQKTPKIIQLTNRNWTESLYNYILNSDTRQGKKITLLCTVPFLTAGSTTFLPSILAGAIQVIINENFTPQELIRYIKEYEVNRLYITPSRLLELLEYCKANNQRLSSLESIITGTERIPAVKLKEAIDFFGPIITIGYGMVEALPPIAMLSPQDYAGKDSSLNAQKLDSVGRIAKGVKVKVSGDGRIAVKSKTVSAGYLDNPDKNAKCFKDGWFYTNDYGFIDKEGFLHISGRKEEILTETPRRIFAKEVEDKLHELAFIKRCAAIQKNNGIYIFASMREKIHVEEAKQEIADFCKTNLMELPSPSDIIIKENLPISPLGKLDRKKLEEDV